ncbi:RadC family protein [Methylocystis iwaonis]|uniref:RadC family protein n=1 Tax=Methylocystis iwaonis TaxID=2885079 RepID=UPI00248F9840|nr:DNA repair protein RadC [Methylocystis iwaonis]
MFRVDSAALAEGMSDSEMLESVLSGIKSKKRRKEVVKRLLDRFGSYGDVVCAHVDRLREVEGVDDRSISALKAVEKSAKLLARATLFSRKKMDSLYTVMEYCNTVMAHEDREQFRALFLDNQNGLIADEVLSVGTVDQTPVYPREVLRRALELGASGLILAHNHPSGDPTPSMADICRTNELVAAAKLFGIGVHDHLIVGCHGNASLRGLGFIGQ